MNSVSIEETAFPTFHDSQLQSLTPHQVRKLTAAAGYYRALLAVHFDENDQAMIWGMVSAGTDWVNRVDAASDRHDDLPENLIIHCLGPGHLIASAGYARVLESANGRILMEGFDPIVQHGCQRDFVVCEPTYLEELGHSSSGRTRSYG